MIEGLLAISCTRAGRSQASCYIEFGGHLIDSALKGRKSRLGTSGCHRRSSQRFLRGLIIREMEWGLLGLKLRFGVFWGFGEGLGPCVDLGLFRELSFPRRRKKLTLRLIWRRRKTLR